MSYLKIVADDKETRTEVCGNALKCLGMLGTSTSIVLAEIVKACAQNNPKPLIDAFCETVKSETQKKLDLGSVQKEREKEACVDGACRRRKEPEEGSCGGNICRCRKEPEAERELTLEDVDSLIDGMSVSELYRLADVAIQKSRDRMGKD